MSGALPKGYTGKAEAKHLGGGVFAVQGSPLERLLIAKELDRLSTKYKAEAAQLSKPLTPAEETAIAEGIGGLKLLYSGDPAQHPSGSKPDASIPSVTWAIDTFRNRTVLRLGEVSKHYVETILRYCNAVDSVGPILPDYDTKEGFGFDNWSETKRSIINRRLIHRGFVVHHVSCDVLFEGESGTVPPPPGSHLVSFELPQERIQEIVRALSKPPHPAEPYFVGATVAEYLNLTTQQKEAIQLKLWELGVTGDTASQEQEVVTVPLKDLSKYTAFAECAELQAKEWQLSKEEVERGPTSVPARRRRAATAKRRRREQARRESPSTTSEEDCVTGQLRTVSSDTPSDSPVGTSTPEETVTPKEEDTPWQGKKD